MKSPCNDPSQSCPEFCSAIRGSEVVGLTPGHSFSECGGSPDDDCVVVDSDGEELLVEVGGERWGGAVVDPAAPIDVDEVIAQADWASNRMCHCPECELEACPYGSGNGHTTCSCDLEVRAACMACINEQAEESVEFHWLPRRIIVELAPGKFTEAVLDWYGDSAAASGLAGRVHPEVFRLVGETLSLKAAAVQIEAGRDR